MFAKSMFFLFCVVYATSAEILRHATPEKGIIVGDVFYFENCSLNRTRQEASEYCKDYGGELAKLTSRSLYAILIRQFSVGSYWIDGTTDLALEPDHFFASKDCTQQDLELHDIPYLGYSTELCLTLVKKATVDESGYEAVPCSNTVNGLICAVWENNSCDSMFA